MIHPPGISQEHVHSSLLECMFWCDWSWSTSVEFYQFQIAFVQMKLMYWVPGNVVFIFSSLWHATCPGHSRLRRSVECPEGPTVDQPWRDSWELLAVARKVYHRMTWPQTQDFKCFFQGCLGSYPEWPDIDHLKLGGCFYFASGQDFLVLIFALERKSLMPVTFLCKQGYCAKWGERPVVFPKFVCIPMYIDIYYSHV